MAIDTDIFDDDLAEMTADLPDTIIVNGASYSVSATDETLTAALDMPGYEPDYDTEFTVRTAVLAAPSVGTLVTYNSRSYRVVRSLPSPDGVSYRLQCGAAG